VGALDLQRDVVRVAGPDAVRYLQGQLSQDVVALAPGEWAWSLVLQPQGKLDAFVRSYRAGPEEMLLDTDAGTGGRLVDRLLRFRLRTRVEVERLDWGVVAVRGPGATAPAQAAPAQVAPAQVAPAQAAVATGHDRAVPGHDRAVPGHDCAVPGHDRAVPGQRGAIAVPFEWGGLVGYDLLGPSPAWPEGAVPVGGQEYEAARIEAGFPRHGAELDERTIPAEAGLVGASVSFTKGCYTGQELVARIDARGSNVPRRLRGLVLSGAAQPGDPLYALDRGGTVGEGTVGEGAEGCDNRPAREVGHLTSVALSPRLGWVALGYVGRSVEVGQTVAVTERAGAVTGRVQLLPVAGPAL
jgi:folate-binding protein YgfZ